MSRVAPRVSLSEAERYDLWVSIEVGQASNATKAEKLVALRCRVVEMAERGIPNKTIAAAIRLSKPTVGRVRRAFVEKGIAGLEVRTRRGRPCVEQSIGDHQFLELWRSLPPKERRWNNLSARLGIRRDSVYRMARGLGCKLERRRSFPVSTGPAFGQKSVEIVGLFLSAPKSALVLSVDHGLKGPESGPKEGQAMVPDSPTCARFNRKYARQGAKTLFAALDVATELVREGRFAHRRGKEWLGFLNRLVAGYPGRTLHVVVDHGIERPGSFRGSPGDVRWTRRHSNVHFRYPTTRSWANQVEGYINLFTGREQVEAGYDNGETARFAIEAFLVSHKENIAPFQWFSGNSNPPP